MADLVDYVLWRGDITFKMSPFNEVDALVLSQLSYCNFDNIVSKEFTRKSLTLRELALKFASSGDYDARSDLGAVINRRTIRLLQTVCESKRFGECKICGFVNKIDFENDEQFSATTFLLTDKTVFIAYRGTDDTIVGWQEDFDLGWKETVPAQTDALLYFNEAASKLHGRIRLGGHSKGANLALYAGVNADSYMRKRICDVYLNDGPGFSEEFFRKEEFISIKDKVHTFMPQLSIVGMLFSHPDEVTVVESDQKGLLQHDPFSWNTQAAGFVELEDLTEDSKLISQTVNKWFNELDREQKKLFAYTVFGVIKGSDVQTNSEIISNWSVTIPKMLKTATNLDSKTKDAVKKTLQLFFKFFFETFAGKLNRSLKTSFAPKPNQKLLTDVNENSKDVFEGKELCGLNQVSAEVSAMPETPETQL